MKGKTLFQNIRKHNGCTNINILLCFICIFLMYSALPGQSNLNPSGKQVNSKDSLNGITIHQESKFNTSPQRLYEILLSSKEFSACTKKSFDNFSTSSATINDTVGGAFSVFDGHIIGRILELVPNQRIVEAWRVIDWPAGVYSIAKFEIRPLDSGAQIIFDHTGFPEGLKESLSSGWQHHYWDALVKYLQ